VHPEPQTVSLATEGSNTVVPKPDTSDDQDGDISHQKVV